MFAVSLMSVAPALEENTVSCTDVAFDTQNKMLKKGHSLEAANDAASSAYDSCVENGGSPN